MAHTAILILMIWTVTWKLARGWLNACLSFRYCLVCSIDAHAAPRLQEAVVGVSINRQSDCWGCQAWQHTNQCWSFLHWGPSLRSESPRERERRWSLETKELVDRKLETRQGDSIYLAFWTEQVTARDTTVIQIDNPSWMGIPANLYQRQAAPCMA